MKGYHMVKIVVKKQKKSKTIDDMKRDYKIVMDGPSVVVKYSNVIITKLELDKGEGEDEVRTYLDSNPSIFQSGWNKYMTSVSKRRTTLKNNSLHRHEIKQKSKDEVLGNYYRKKMEKKLSTKRGNSKN